MDEDSTAQTPDAQSSPEPKGSMAADFSLILGILSNSCFWFVSGIPAIILGLIAIRNINRNPTAITGIRRAEWGIGTACIGMLVWPILFIMTAFFDPGVLFDPNHPASDRSKCRLQMSTIEKLIISYGNLNGIKAGQQVLVQALIDEEYISKLPACPDDGTYTYTGKMPSGDVGSAPYIRCSFKGHDFAPYKTSD